MPQALISCYHKNDGQVKLAFYMFEIAKIIWTQKYFRPGMSRQYDYYGLFLPADELVQGSFFICWFNVKHVKVASIVSLHRDLTPPQGGGKPRPYYTRAWQADLA